VLSIYKNPPFVKFGSNGFILQGNIYLLAPIPCLPMTAPPNFFVSVKWDFAQHAVPLLSSTNTELNLFTVQTLLSFPAEMMLK
jgi:hypothetical protein